ncbi:TIGR03086 family metal-binding protein [Nocardia sp. NBC_00565]|uniref:TIGR03086 family metal-binding protein n=1 Tax=Nocardia sp. NBC_00565 TaxID=2975993 RepID=UPI002E801AA3|nr:TIGR03086 family metal-binding protein [Nocardia sp. NBC_00565]WUC04962.1 TIGR03086 family metal-binding protein [Nocardia sp. NBC_00565]
MDTFDTVDLLEHALTQMGEVIAGIRPEQAALPTPCTGWDVHALVRHVIGQSLRNFLVSARGEMADWAAPPEELGPDWAVQFRAAAAPVLDTWRSADLDRLVPVPGGKEAPLRGRADQQLTELAMHAWDLVRATGQDRELDPDIAEHGLAWSHTMLRPEFRGPDRAFGLEVPVAPDAPAYDRLAGWFGRDPAWKSPGQGSCSR